MPVHGQTRTKKPGRRIGVLSGLLDDFEPFAGEFFGHDPRDHTAILGQFEQAREGEFRAEVYQLRGLPVRDARKLHGAAQDAAAVGYEVRKAKHTALSQNPLRFRRGWVVGAGTNQAAKQAGRIPPMQTVMARTGTQELHGEFQ